MRPWCQAAVVGLGTWVPVVCLLAKAVTGEAAWWWPRGRRLVLLVTLWLAVEAGRALCGGPGRLRWRQPVACLSLPSTQGAPGGLHGAPHGSPHTACVPDGQGQAREPSEPPGAARACTSGRELAGSPPNWRSSALPRLRDPGLNTRVLSSGAPPALEGKPGWHLPSPPHPAPGGLFWPGLWQDHQLWQPPLPCPPPARPCPRPRSILQAGSLLKRHPRSSPGCPPPPTHASHTPRPLPGPRPAGSGCPMDQMQGSLPAPAPRSGAAAGAAGKRRGL